MTEATSTAAMASAPASVSHAPAAPVPPIGLREKHKRRTRAAIRAAAMELFDANGYAQTTVAQIAEAADVSHTTFFRYFQSKEQVVISDDLDDEWQAVLEAIPPGLGRFDLLRAMVRGLVELVLADDWASDPARMKLIQSEPALLLVNQIESDRAISEAADFIADYLGVERDNPRLRVFIAGGRRHDVPHRQRHRGRARRQIPRDASRGDRPAGAGPTAVSSRATQTCRVRWSLRRACVPLRRD